MSIPKVDLSGYRRLLEKRARHGQIADRVNFGLSLSESFGLSEADADRLREFARQYGFVSPSCVAILLGEDD